MPKIESFPILKFADGKLPISKVIVPFGSKFLKVKLTHEGIFAFFEVPTLILADGQNVLFPFKVCDPKELIPDNATFVDIIDVIIEQPNPENVAEPTQGLMLFPIYLLNS